MRRLARVVPLVVLVVTAASCTRLTPEQQFVQDVAQALGGADRVRAARLLTLEGTGRHWNLGQDMRPGLADQTFTVSAFTRTVDLQQHRMRTTLTRTPNFAYFQGPQAQTQIQGVDGDVAYNGNTPEKLARAGRVAVTDRRAERFHHPLVLVRAALAGGANVSPVRTTGTERVVDVTTDAGVMTLVVGADNRPTRISSLSSHINLGDVTITTRFSGYAEGGGFTLPATFATQTDDFTTAEYTVTSTVANDGTVEVPDTVKAAAEPSPAAPNVTAEEVAPGVWFLAGQSHHSVAVAFKDKLVLIEAPQSDARSTAVIAKAKELSPKTPLTHLVLSHHHFDHSTGLRAALAEGLTVVTHAGNADFVKMIAARPFTRQPDALAKAAKSATVEAVADTHTITDGTRSLVLYHLAGNPHTDTMLMAYLPRERVLVEVDAFSPGGNYHPYAANLLEHITRRKLRVDKILPLHGAPVTVKDVEAAVKPAA
jgi:glyoxylase-like metal-dependent hydrolase (beta-lactamase superfamily II)